MKTKIWLALSALILTSLMAPPIMGMGPEKEKGECQVTSSEARQEHRKEITALRMSQREECQTLISLRREQRKEITAFRISKRAAG